MHHLIAENKQQNEEIKDLKKVICNNTDRIVIDNLKELVNQLEESIRSALKISDIWLFGDDVNPGHLDEARALISMENKFVEALERVKEMNETPIEIER